MTYPAVLGFLSALLFGAATPASKALLDSIPPFQLAGLLYLGAALGVLPWFLKDKRSYRLRALDKTNRFRLLGAIGFGGIIGPVLLLLGLRLASAASVSLWLNLELAVTVLLGHFVFKDHLGRFGWIGAGGVVLGGCVLSAEQVTGGVQAGLFVGLACVCWGIDNHLTALIDGISATQTTFWKGIIAGGVNLSLGLGVETFEGNPVWILPALIVGAFAYGASIVLYILASQGMGATRAQMIFAMSPFLGAGLAVPILGETLSRWQLVSGLLIVVSLALVLLDRHGHKHAHVAVGHTHWHRHDDGHHGHDHPGRPKNRGHSHAHKHEPLVHAHPHWPDLHHRHGHSETMGA